MPLSVQPEQQLPELHDALRVQAVDGLVQQEELRLVHQGEGQPKPLLHAQGEGLEFFLPGPGEADQLQRLVHAAPAGDAPLDAVVLQILFGGEIGVEGGGLHHDAGAAPRPVQGGGGGGAEEGQLSGGGPGLAGDQPDQGGLARAVPAHQAEDLPLFHRQAGPVQGQGPAIPAGQLPGPQDQFRHSVHLSF